MTKTFELSRFTSGAFAAPDRLDVLNDVYSAIERVDIELLDDDNPHFDVQSLALPEIVVLKASVSPMAPSRSRAQADDGKDDLVLAFITHGTVQFSPAGGAELELRAGDTYLGHNDRASRHALYDKPGFLDISIPRSRIGPLVKDLDEVGRGKLAPTPELTLLGNYARMLMESGQIFTPALAKMCETHLVDLAAMALGPRRDAEELASGRGVREARLSAIRDDIEANLTETWLGVETIARRHKISPQYLRALFYKEGTSFSDYVRDRRLDRALDLLTDPASAHLRISDIAFSCGFGDLSHFNLSFRKRFAMTPSEARAREGA